MGLNLANIVIDILHGPWWVPLIMWVIAGVLLMVAIWLWYWPEN